MDPEGFEQHGTAVGRAVNSPVGCWLVRGSQPIGMSTGETAVPPHRFVRCGVFFMSYQFGAEPLASGQFAGNACLNSAQQGFMLFGKTIKDLAANREVTPTAANNIRTDKFFLFRSSFRYEDNILPDAHPLDEQKHTTGNVMLHRKASAYSAAPGAVQPALYTEYGSPP